MIKDKRGFTLIELLIVIVILGILAAALLSAINPIEQIRKAADSGKKSDSAEMLNALERYYTTFQEYPWEAAGAACITPNGVNPNVCWLDELVAVDEVKGEFIDRENITASLFVTETANELVYVCFDPESTSFEADADRTVSGGTGCVQNGTECYVCLPE